MRRSLRNTRRLLAILVILVRHDALFPIEQLPRLRPIVRLLRRFAPRPARGRPGERLAQALQSMGPGFIKLGQTMATRPIS